MYLGPPACASPAFSQVAIASHPNNHWEAPKFNLNSSHQSEDWKVFYTRALDYLEALDINTDEWCICWKQLNMMFEGKDGQTLQSLINN